MSVPAQSAAGLGGREGRGAARGIVTLHYRRLPDREQRFRQIVVHLSATYVVTLLEAAELSRPVRVAGRTVLEHGAPVVWITYPGRWHDLGRFHTADGVFTGVYANVLTPVEMQGALWRTTDLCLDVWQGADGTLAVLDQDELAAAERAGWTDAETAARARSEAGALLEAGRRGEWPPPEAREWTLERARRAVAHGCHPHHEEIRDE
jgi:predicted RNA-binding protein associated with RNAse of E/G family